LFVPSVPELEILFLAPEKRGHRQLNMGLEPTPDHDLQTDSPLQHRSCPSRSFSDAWSFPPPAANETHSPSRHGLRSPSVVTGDL
ncbi:MAG: hypothetical protein KF722_13390, partial [Nitrospira sp.]|nr:hypothetical protein [Nitrospira sp.]